MCSVPLKYCHFEVYAVYLRFDFALFSLADGAVLTYFRKIFTFLVNIINGGTVGVFNLFGCFNFGSLRLLRLPCGKRACCKYFK